MKKKKNNIIAIFPVLALLAAVALAQTTAGGESTQRNGSPTSAFFDSDRLLKDVEYLASDELEGRSADRESIKKVRDFVEKRFSESGLSPIGEGYRQQFEIASRRDNQRLTGINFVGKIEGKAKAGKVMVITAHYDHVGISQGQIYNGADDNASGTAALFAIASHFSKHKPQITLIFVALDAEERGLQGARHFVANLPVPKETILLNINMDMISRNEKNELYAAGTFHYPQFKPALEAVQKTAKIKLLLGHDDPKLGRDDWTNQSDHAAFHRAGIPFVYFGVEDHKDYHRPTDDFANIQPVFFVKAVETVIDSIKAIDKAK